MLGLLVFGHFFGIIGMVISTPLLAAFKAIILFFDKKYAILDIN
jgi:predicted PurR-regulated permease PerM